MLFDYLPIFFVLLINVCRISLLLSNNKVYSILYLIFIYMSTSILFMYMGITIVGLFYFLVYIGAVAVLFLLPIMLLNLKEVNLVNDYFYLLSFMLLFTILAIQIYISFNSFDFLIYNIGYDYYYNINDILQLIGLIVFKNYNIVLLFIGFILLIAMIGAIYLTNKKRGFFIKNQEIQLARSLNINYFNLY